MNPKYIEVINCRSFILIARLVHVTAEQRKTLNALNIAQHAFCVHEKSQRCFSTVLFTTCHKKATKKSRQAKLLSC